MQGICLNTSCRCTVIAREDTSPLHIKYPERISSSAGGVKESLPLSKKLSYATKLL